MKISNENMRIYFAALKAIADRAKGKAAYGVARNMRKIAEEGVEYENICNEAIRKYGTQTDDGQINITVGTKAFADYMKEIEPYRNIEHEVDIFKVKPDEFFDSDLNANEIMAIDFMIEDA
jgi:hypothetical protein